MPTFPSNNSFLGLNPRDHPRAFGEYPWYDWNFVGDDSIIEYYRYTDSDQQVVPGGIPVRALRSFEWRHRIAMRANDLGTYHRVWRNGR